MIRAMLDNAIRELIEDAYTEGFKHGYERGTRCESGDGKPLVEDYKWMQAGRSGYTNRIVKGILGSNG